MKFGYIGELDSARVDFKLPLDGVLTQSLLDKLPHRNTSPKVYLGCPTWITPNFSGYIYPKNLHNIQSQLVHYCKQFNAIELNTTFRITPTIQQVKKWKSAATAGFKFCPKLPRAISHSNDLARQRTLLEIFLESVLHFEENLGVIFMQLSPYCKTDRVDRLQKFLTCIPKDIPFAIECRHPLWFSQKEVQHDFLTFLHEQGIAAVITDVGGRRDVLHQTLTTNHTFIRFVSNNIRSTDYKRIDDWLVRINQWCEQGLEEVYFFIHEYKNEINLDLITYMAEQFNQKTEIIRVTLPSFLDEK